MLIRSGRHNGERGAVLPLIALSIAALMGFAALAVDLGNVTNARRQDQINVDQATLAAAQELGDESAVVSTAIAFANRNNTAAAFTAADFDGCDAADQPPRFTAISGASCVSIDNTGNRVRVVLPVRESDTVFAAVLGISEFDHSAEATAAIVPLGGSVLPLGLPNGASGTVCLKVGSANVPDADCNDNAAGNFGFINFAFYGSAAMNTGVDCTGNGKNGRLANNIAAGLDHDISVWGTGVHGAVSVLDLQNGPCGAAGLKYPNGTDTVIGNIPTVFGRGLYADDVFSDGGPARLQRPGADYGSGPVTTSIAGVDLDDVPLYDYIGDLTGADVPDSCHREQFVGVDGVVDTGDDLAGLDPGVAQHLESKTLPDRMVALIERCTQHYQGNEWTDGGAYFDNSNNPPTGELPLGCSGGSSPACEDPVFNADSAVDVENDLWDIQYSPRFAYVPELNVTSSQLNGNTTVLFVDIRPVFLQRVFGGNCNGTGCDFIFDPGFQQTYNGNTEKAFAMKAFVIPGAMLPGRLGDSDAPYAIGVNRFIQLVG